MDGQFDPLKVYEMLAKIISAREGVEIRVVRVTKKNDIKNTSEVCFDKPAPEEV